MIIDCRLFHVLEAADRTAVHVHESIEYLNRHWQFECGIYSDSGV